MIDYSTYTLANGLKVVHNFDPSTAMVAVCILYNVGARDEHPSHTGLAHLLEHLMFGGSANVPDFDAQIERAGGINNAWTSNDFTCFYDVAPAQNLDTLLWAESDRMIGPSLTPKVLDVQRHVVIEEFKETHLNRPYGDLMHRLRALAYTTHPYRYPTIGKEISHIENVTAEEVRDFFNSHYAPNNAILAVSGNVSLEQLKESTGRWFSDVPRRVIAPRHNEPEPKPTEARREEVRGAVPQTEVYIAFHMPGYGEPGYRECDLLTDILASGRSSRFYRRLLLGSDLFTQADASIMGSEEPGLLMLRGRLSEDSDEAIAEAERLLMAEATALWQPRSEHDPDGVETFELERAINRFASQHTFSSLSYLHRAQELAMAALHGEDINSIVEAYRRVTLSTLCATARTVIAPERACTLVYRPEEPNI